MNEFVFSRSKARGSIKGRATTVPPKKSIHIRLSIVIGLIAVFIFPAILAAPSSAKTLTPLEKGMAFYKGATITMMVPDTAGDTLDRTSRALSQYMSQYLHATINTLDNGAASGTPDMNALASANPNGLTIGMLNILNLASQVLTNTPGLTFNAAREEYIAAQGPNALVLVGNPSSPDTSFAALRDSGTPVGTLVDDPGSSATMISVLFGVLGVHAHYISGYTGAAAVAQGFERGDGPVTFLGLSNVGPFFQSNLAVPLAISVKVSAGEDYRKYVLGVPTVAQLLAKYPPKTKEAKTQALVLQTMVNIGDPYVTQTSVPTYKLLALRAAAAWAFKQSGFKSLVLAAGFNPHYVDPVFAKSEYLAVLKDGISIKDYIAGL